MNRKIAYFFILISMLTLPLTACELSASSDIDIDTEIAMAVALTQTAAAMGIETEPSENPEPAAPEGDFQPLNTDECQALMEAMSQTLGVSVETTQVQVERRQLGQNGAACQLTAAFDGGHINGDMNIINMLNAVLKARGWVGDAMDALQGECLGAGGWGPGAFTTCFVQDDKMCQPFVYLQPIDNEVCNTVSQDRPCFEQLAPEQKLYTAQITCSQGLEIPEITLAVESELQRIEFPAGGTSTQLSGTLTSGSVDHYVLWAEANQQLGTLIYPPGVISVAVIGEDGTVLKSDLNNISDWTGVLPTTQDYYINVRSMIDADTEYTLDVVIPPLEPVATTGEIAGGISYTGEYIPPLHIVAYNLETNLWYFLKTNENTPYYTLPGLPSGKYQVVAYTQDDLIGGYVSAGVELIAVTVIAGETTESIDLISWYEPGTVAFASDPVGW